MTGIAETGVLAGEQRMLIDGELQLTDGGKLFDVEHPATDSNCTTVQSSDWASRMQKPA